jgi:uncharacterized protein (TIGR02001 family)
VQQREETHVRRVKVIGAGLALLAVPALGVRAELSATVAIASDYVWRGVSQTDEGPALQLGAEYAHDLGFYVGVWGSSVDYDEDVDDPARVEVDLYAGWRGETGWGLGWDVGVLRYLYPDTTEDFDYTEWVVSLSYGMLTLEIDYSSDVFATGEDGLYYNLSVSHELPEFFTLTASVGYSELDEEVNGKGEPDSYVDWRIGVSRELWGLDWDLSYYDTAGGGEDLYGRLAEARLVLTASMSF